MRPFGLFLYARACACFLRYFLFQFFMLTSLSLNDKIKRDFKKEV
nr:MAG TPA: hypothetical protein [Caudoviricetes sp.]